MARILLDAGHYGKQNRYHALKQLEYYESQMAWKLHLFQKEALESRGHEVGLTREKQDVDLHVQRRGHLVEGYDILISNHSNTVKDPTVERAVVIPLWDDLSESLANELGACIRDVMGLSSYQVYQPVAKSDRDGNKATKDSYYGILFGAQSKGGSAIILEHGFHTHQPTAEWLCKEENLRKLAEAEAEVIDRFFRARQSEGISAGDKVTIKEGAYYKGDTKAVPEKYINGKIFTVSRLITSNGSKFALLEEITSWVDIDYLSKINATESPKRLFSDVDENSKFYDVIKRSVDLGIISADPNANFNPEQSFSKVEVLELLQKWGSKK